MTYWVAVIGKVLITDADSLQELVGKIRVHVAKGEAIAFSTPPDTSGLMAEWLSTAPRDVLLDPEKDIPSELWLDVNTATMARQAAKAQMN
jgi:hypothetical protein